MLISNRCCGKIFIEFGIDKIPLIEIGEYLEVCIESDGVQFEMNLISGKSPSQSLSRLISSKI